MSFPAGSFPINATVVESQVSVTYETVSGGLTVLNGITTDRVNVNGNSRLGNEANDVSTVIGSFGVTGSTMLSGNLEVDAESVIINASKDTFLGTNNKALINLNSGNSEEVTIYGKNGVYIDNTTNGVLITGGTVPSVIPTTGLLVTDTNLYFTGDLGVTGNINLEGNLIVTGNTRLEGDLSVIGYTRLEGQFNASIDPPSSNDPRAYITISEDAEISLFRSDASGNGKINIDETNKIDILGNNGILLRSKGAYIEVDDSDNEEVIIDGKNGVYIHSDEKINIIGNTDGVLIKGGQNPATIPTEGLLVTDTNLYFTGDLGLTGNINLEGNLSVTGNTNLNGNLGVTGSINLEGNLGVTGTTSLYGNLGVTGNTNLEGNLGVDGSATIQGTTRLVGGIIGKVNIDGIVNILNNLNVVGSTALTGGISGGLTVNGNEQVTGALTVEGSINTNSGLFVGTDLVVNSGAAINHGVNIGGSALIGGGLSVQGAAVLADDLTLSSGNLTLTSGNLNVKGSLDIENNTLLHEDLEVNGSSIFKAVDIDGILNVTGPANLTNGLTVQGSVNLLNELNVSETTTTTSLNVGEDTELNGTLSAATLNFGPDNIQSKLNLNNDGSLRLGVSKDGIMDIGMTIDIDRNISLGTEKRMVIGSGGSFFTMNDNNDEKVVLSAAKRITIESQNNGTLIKGGTVPSVIPSTGLLVTDTNLYFNGNFGLTGNTNLNGNLEVTGNTNLNGNLGVTGNTNLNGNLGVTGNTNLNGNFTVAGTGTTTFSNKLVLNNDLSGTATLVGGTILVNTTKALTNSLIFLQRKSAGTTHVYVSAIVNATSFTITSSNGGDTSSVQWMIVNSS